MSRDVRGTPGRAPGPPGPRMRLADVIRRHRTTLGSFASELGITTYSGMEIWCRRMGVAPPTEAEFVSAVPVRQVNNPREGVIVLEPPAVIDEITGRSIDPDAKPVEPGLEVIVSSSFADGDSSASQKKVRRKKDVLPVEP